MAQIIADFKDDAAEAAPKDSRGKVIAEYRVFLTKPQKHIMLLQFPNRDRNQPYNDATHQKPLALRIKPKCGLVELDVPINLTKNFDRVRGIEYGQALKKNKVVRQGGSFGMAGGFGVNSQSRAGRDDGPGGVVEVSEEALLEDFYTANNEGNVMNKMTLGGKILRPKDGEPMYAIGVFRGKELHLSQVDAICLLQPQFAHLDAIADNEKSSTRAQRDTENPPPETEARAVNMAVKSSEDDDVDTSEIASTLRAMQEEEWEHLEWIDEEDPVAYGVYDEELFLPEGFKSQRLVSAMTNAQYLDAVSAPRIDPSNQGKKVMMDRPHDDDETTDTDGDEMDKDVGRGGEEQNIEGENSGEQNAGEEHTAGVEEMDVDKTA